MLENFKMLLRWDRTGKVKDWYQKVSNQVKVHKILACAMVSYSVQGGFLQQNAQYFCPIRHCEVRSRANFTGSCLRYVDYIIARIQIRAGVLQESVFKILCFEILSFPCLQQAFIHPVCYKICILEIIKVQVFSQKYHPKTSLKFLLQQFRCTVFVRQSFFNATDNTRIMDLPLSFFVCQFLCQRLEMSIYNSAIFLVSPGTERFSLHSTFSSRRS